MSSLLWINEVKVYSGWHLELLFIWRWIFKAVQRKCLWQSAHNETWTKNLFWQPAKAVNWWKVRRELVLLCPSKFNCFVNTWYHPPWHFHFYLTSAAILSLYSWVYLSWRQMLWFNLPIIEGHITPLPQPSKSTHFKKSLKWLLLNIVASIDVPSLPLKATLLQVS